MKNTESFKGKLIIHPTTWSQEKVPAESLVFWKSYFDLAYYLGLSSYRFEWNSDTSNWRVVENTVQKVSIFKKIS